MLQNNFAFFDSKLQISTRSANDIIYNSIWRQIEMNNKRECYSKLMDLKHI